MVLQDCNNIARIKLAFLFLTASFMAGCAMLPEPNFSPESPSLKIVTYNVNWGTQEYYLIKRFLLNSEADIICLQETHIQLEKYLKSHLFRLYPYTYFHSSSGAGGIAFMSKKRLGDVRVLQAEAGWFPALMMNVETGIGPVQVLNVHLKPPLDENASVTLSAFYKSPGIHRKELGYYLGFVAQDVPLVIAGDFNENERQGAIKDLLGNNYTDALSLYDKRSYTWSWPVFLGLSIKDRYDHIIYSSELHCTGAKVVDIDLSHHRPVVAVIVRKGDAANGKDLGR